MRLETATATLPFGINAQEFISAVGPSLGQGNFEEALKCVRARWTPPQIAALLQDKSSDVRKMAALTLSVVGEKSAVTPLAVVLHDQDPMVVQIAEHALWSIWFRLGTSRAVDLVMRGNTHMHHENFDSAVEKFSQAIQEDPTFAEAYNQRAITHYLAERYEESIADCKAALARVPQHFGAMSGMGHCHAYRGEWRQAKHCYRLALAIHPRLEGIQGSLDQIERLLRENPEL